MHAAKTVLIVSVALLAIGFIGCAWGGYSNAQIVEGGGADIGAGVALVFGTLFGLAGLAGLVIVVLMRLVSRGQSRTSR